MSHEHVVVEWALVVALALVLFGRPKVDIPRIGYVAGFAVGLTTKEQFETKHGKGLAFTGGHPRGGRTWYDPTLHLKICINPFNYSDDGAVADGVSVEWIDAKDLESHVPRIHLKRNERGILDSLRRGMSLREVEQVLHLRFVGGEAHQKGLVQYSHRLVNWDKDRFVTWTIKLAMRQNLEGFDVTAE